MTYRMQPLSCNPARLTGLSEKLLVSHYENNYGGAVKRLNAVTEQLASLDFAHAPAFLVNGLKREEAIARNSMTLHELYFDGLGAGVGPSGTLYDALVRDFGSYARWHEQFSGIGRALAGGSGWVVLAYSTRDDALSNHWMADHAQAPAGCAPLLALDMYEHAYHLDYAADAARYVDAFMHNIRWENVMRLYLRACALVRIPERSIPPGALQQRLADSGQTVVLLDVRQRTDYETDDQTISGAHWRDPENVEEWSRELRKEEHVIVYCEHGGAISASIVDHLLQAGIHARYIEGGIAAWRESGGQTVAKNAP